MDDLGVQKKRKNAIVKEVSQEVGLIRLIRLIRLVAMYDDVR
jgi:hypothetical protein